MRKRFATALVVAVSALASAMAFPTSAHASLFLVDALGNSSSGGVGAATISLTSGQAFTVSVDPNDLWSAGALPRWSDANGLDGNLFATGTDESGEPNGTLIGQDFGLWNQAGLSAPYGTLVGEIGGVFVALGTSFNGLAWGTGTLNLYYWDSNAGDNTEHITANVSLVPEPGVLALVATAFLLLLVGGLMRRRVG